MSLIERSHCSSFLGPVFSHADFENLAYFAVIIPQRVEIESV